jgi:hypothetical protein
MIRGWLFNPLYKLILSLRLKPKTFQFQFLTSTDRIGFLKALGHYAMYYYEPEAPSKLILYPSWKTQTRTLEEWNTSLPKRKKPVQPPKANKKEFWEYQYFYSLYSYEHTNYKRDKIQSYVNEPLRVAQIVDFIQNHNHGWHLPPPTIGVSFDIIELDILFYKGEEFLGSIGLKNKNTLCILVKDKRKRYAQQYIREISDEESSFLFSGIDIK